jgi:hypothetical protein
VRAVRLAAAREALIRRGATLLQDALHTATLSGTRGGRVVAIRSLDVGTIDPRQSAASLALSIDERMRTLSAGALDARLPEAAYHSCVTFPSATDAYVALAVRVALQHGTTAWFWPLVAPSWHPDLPRDEALRRLVFGVLQEPTHVAGAALLLGELRRRGAIDALLSALRWQDGAELLRHSGWRRSQSPSSVVDRERDRHGPAITSFAGALPSSWSSVLRTWVPDWGSGDPRSTWLTAVVLVSEEPARLHDAGLLVGVEQTVLQVVHQARPQARGDDAPDGRAGAMGGRPQRGHTSHTAPIHPLDASTSRDRTPAAAFRADAQTKLQERHDAPLSWRPVVDEAGAAPSDEHGQSTDHGGFFFALSILERLDVGGLLASCPHVIGLDFVVRLLHHLRRRTGVPDGDVVLRAMPPDADANPNAPCEFVVPRAWREHVCASDPWILRPLTGSGGATVLRDSSDRMVLSLWRGPPRDELLELIAGIRTVAGKETSAASDMTVLLDSWLTAMRRWSHRYAGMGLVHLVRRPARVIATRTHVDVAFPADRADVRIRKAGLDIDLGWVSWLGRVVQFHYTDHDDD